MSSTRYIVWLLCALIIAVSVDTVPDPPAVKDPYRCNSSLLSDNHLQVLPSQLMRDRHFAPLSRPLRWNALVYAGEPDLSDEHYALLLRSTDPSPPVSIL